MATHTKALGLTLDPKFTYITHTFTTFQYETHKTLIKELTATGWGEPKKALVSTYKSVMIPALENAFDIVASSILQQH